MAPVAAPLIAPMVSLMIQPVASSLISVIHGKEQECRFIPLLALFSLIKVLRKGVTRRGKGVTKSGRGYDMIKNF